LPYLQKILAYKSLYNDFIRKADAEGVDRNEMPECVDNVDELFDVLHINDFSRDWLNTAVIFDDYLNS
jgi:hypothetical protein